MFRPGFLVGSLGLLLILSAGCARRSESAATDPAGTDKTPMTVETNGRDASRQLILRVEGLTCCAVDGLG